MVTEIISSIGQWVSGFITTIVEAIGSVVPLFYDADTSKLTFVGVLALMGLGIGLVTLAIAFVRGLINK